MSAKNYVCALGGNVLLSYHLSAQDSGGRAYKSQTYNFFTITGDVALVWYENTNSFIGSYEGEDNYPATHEYIDSDIPAEGFLDHQDYMNNNMDSTELKSTPGITTTSMNEEV